MDKHHPHRCRSVLRRWLPFVAGYVKTNNDGAMFRELDKAGIGEVIHNCEGQVLVALSE